MPLNSLNKSGKLQILYIIKKQNVYKKMVNTLKKFIKKGRMFMPLLFIMEVSKSILFNFCIVQERNVL